MPTRRSRFGDMTYVVCYSGVGPRRIAASCGPILTPRLSCVQVMLTEKVVFCIVMVPSLWLFYALLLTYLTTMDGPAIALTVLSMPVFAYVGIIVSDAGMVDLQDLRPYFMRLFPSTRKRLAQLPLTRKALQHDLRTFIKSIGKRNQMSRTPV